LAPPVIAGNEVIVHSNDGRIFSLDAADGRRLWVYDGSVPALSLRGSSRPLVAEGKVIAGLDNGKVVALALGDGQVEWEMTVAVPEGRSELERLVDIDADPLYLDGVVYVAAYNGRVVAVSMLSGRVLWSRDISSYSSMAVSGDIIVVSGSDGTVWGLDRSSGAVMWRQDQLEGRALTAPAVQNGQFAIADDQGFVHWLAPRDGAFVARSHLDDVGITSIVSVDDILYTVSKAAELHAVKIRARARPPE
jgi:outer membrane protein assembly factor BamB